MSSTRRSWLLGVTAVGASAFYLALILAGTDDALLAVVGNVLMILASGTAAVVCLGQARGSSRPRVWYLFATYCGLWKLGQVVWAHAEVVRGEVLPFPALADVGYVGGAAIGALAAMSLPVRDDTITKFRAVLDGLLVALSLLYVAWAFSLGRLIEADTSAMAVAIGFAYPVLDALVLTIVVTLIARIGVSLQVTTYLLVVGLACIGVSDAFFAYERARARPTRPARSSTSGGSPGSCCWLPARKPRGPARRKRSPARRSRFPSGGPSSLRTCSACR